MRQVQHSFMASEKDIFNSIEMFLSSFKYCPLKAYKLPYPCKRYMCWGIVLLAKNKTNKERKERRKNDSLPLYTDIENHPPARLPSNMVGCSSGRVVSSWWMVWWMAGYWCDQPILGRRSHCSSSWLQLTSTSVGKIKPFQNRSGTMCCKYCSLAQDTRPIL